MRNHRVPSSRAGRPAHRRGRAGAGFTLVEMLVVLAILAGAMALGLPALQNLIVRSKTEGFAREAAVLMQRTRLESIKRNREGAVYLDPTDRGLVAFLDADRNRAFDRTTTPPDRWLGRIDLPSSLEFEKPGGVTGLGSVDGLTSTVDVGGSNLPAVVFRPDGSVLETGAFRIADVRGNFLEIRVEPRATGRVEVLKHDGTSFVSTGDPSDAGYEPWKWK